MIQLHFFCGLLNSDAEIHKVPFINQQNRLPASVKKSDLGLIDNNLVI